MISDGFSWSIYLLHGEVEYIQRNDPDIGLHTEYTY